jgi:hypothetical protein
MAVPTSVAADAASTLLTRLTTFTPTITATAGGILTLSVAATAPASKAAAQSILDKGGHAPNVYLPTNPLPMFIIQAFIIVALSKLLSIPLARLRQPKVGYLHLQIRTFPFPHVFAFLLSHPAATSFSSTTHQLGTRDRTRLTRQKTRNKKVVAKLNQPGLALQGAT